MTRAQSHAYTSPAWICGWVALRNNPRSRMLRTRMAQNVRQIYFLIVNQLTSLPSSKPEPDVHHSLDSTFGAISA